MTRARILDVSLAAGAVAGFLAALAIAVHPLGPTRIGPLVIAARDPARPLLAALLLGIIAYVRSPRLAEQLRRVAAAAAERAGWGAAAMALGVFAAAAIFGAFVAGGSDSYGYISQADLWLRGDLHVAQPFAAGVPWQDARWAFTPLGYRPAADGVSIVPTYAPGLPLLMAAAKWIGGQCALFLVVPLAAAALVWATYLIAARLGRPLVGLAAAMLVAVSPTMLYSAMGPLSDLPAAAMWAAAVAGVLGSSRRSAFGGGAAAAAAILIRPNLIVLAGLCGLFLAARDVAARRPGAARRWRTAWFAAPVVLGAAAVAAINARLYGSPLLSGYGSLDFAWSHVSANLRTYPAWLVIVESPAAIVGLAAAFVPAAALWRSPGERRARWLFAAWVLALGIMYAAYTVFDTWTYLRFFLPIWPLMMTGTAAVLAALYRSSVGWRQAAALAIVVWLVAHGLLEGQRRGVYAVAADEQRYIAAARMVEHETPADAVILTVQHSGSLRYYAGRMTVRWESIDRATLDTAVDWLAAHGHPPYILAEGWEAAQIVRQYGPANAAGRLDWPPVAVLEGPAAITLYEAKDRRPSTASPKRVAAAAPAWSDRCRLPEQPSGFLLR